MITLWTTERDYPWGTLRSTHASKTKVVLEEKRLPYRVENLPPGHLWKKPPEMLARHPLGKVPYIDDDGLVIFDSTVINEYLDERYGPPRLLPANDPAARARVRQLEQFGDEALLGETLPGLWMPYWSPPEKRDLERMEKARERLRARDLPYLGRVLAQAEPGGCLGGAFSMADVVAMVVAMVLEVDATALDSFPQVSAYLERLRQRPSYRAISPATKVADALQLSA